LPVISKIKCKNSDVVLFLLVLLRGKMLKNEYYVLPLTTAAAILTFMLPNLATNATSPWQNNLLRSVILLFENYQTN